MTSAAEIFDTHDKLRKRCEEIAADASTVPVFEREQFARDLVDADPDVLTWGHKLAWTRSDVLSEVYAWL